MTLLILFPVMENANGCARMETKFMQVEDKDGNIGNYH